MIYLLILDHGASTLMKIREVKCGNIEFFKLSLPIILDTCILTVFALSTDNRDSFDNYTSKSSFRHRPYFAKFPVIDQQEVPILIFDPWFLKHMDTGE